MKKIVIILAFIFVGMANAMHIQRSLLDGNDMPQYVYTDPAKIAYLKDIQGLYHRIQQEDVQSCIQEEIQSEGRTKGPGIEQLFYFLEPVFSDCSRTGDVQSRTQEERTSGPSIEQIFYFLKPVQNHNVSHIESFESDSYLTEHENDEKKEVSAASLIFDFLQKSSVKKAEERQNRAAVDRQEKQLREEKSKSRKRTLEEAASSDGKNRGLSKEPVVSNTSKKVARKSSTVSEKMKICGINDCRYHTAVSGHMKHHKETLHEQEQCPYPGCSTLCQSKSDFSQHIDDAHPEICCKICGYKPKRRCELLRHFRGVEHLRKLASINLGKGRIV